MHYIERIFCGVILLPAILQTASAQYQGWQHSGSIYLLTTPEGANLPASASEDGFADVFWPMFTSGFEARRKLGADYAVAGKDGVHPGWAGHVLMAYVYLQSMGLDGEIATINQAAQVLQPGQRVIVAAGVYRERLRPARGGSGPEAMISYEAAPGAQVVLKGSRVFREMWVRVEADAGASVWQARLDPKYSAGAVQRTAAETDLDRSVAADDPQRLGLTVWRRNSNEQQATPAPNGPSSEDAVRAIGP